MWFKLMGCVLMIFAGGLTAGAVTGFERKKLSVLDAWLELLLYIRAQIDCYLMPIDQILALADKRLLRACMASENAHSLSAILQGSMPYLDAECQRLLTALVRELGTSYREEQLKRCDYYIQALQLRREKLETALPSRLKLGTTISFCVAIGTAILLW